VIFSRGKQASQPYPGSSGRQGIEALLAARENGLVAETSRIDHRSEAVGKHSPKGQIVVKKDQKLAAVAAAIPQDCSDEIFADKFKKMYPHDWDRIVQRYQQHENATPVGKKNPMAEPAQYLLNMVKVYRVKVSKTADGT